MLLESEQLAEKISAAESTKTVENCTFYEGEPPSCGLVCAEEPKFCVNRSPQANQILFLKG
jgi:hypothetical protein